MEFSGMVKRDRASGSPRSLVLVCVCKRRIFDGIYTAFDKRYMVYFVRSEFSNTLFPIGLSWICGGAIVSPTQILTSAACLYQYHHLYAIAGYRKYVNSHDLKNDECTWRWKQRVVKTCIPKGYKYIRNQPNDWLRMDIGVATVQKPYNFSDLTWRLHCHYVPDAIKILYEQQYQTASVDVLMLGWGASEQQQRQNILDINSPYLREASGKIIAKNTCGTSLRGAISVDIINKYLICVQGKGVLGGDGAVLDLGDLDKEGCSRRNMRDGDPRCFNTTSYEDDYFDFRRNMNKTITLSGATQQNGTVENLVNTRRQGICQNDHGSPLVTWVGKEEVLIGIAATALMGSRYECIGPSLFTSTHCTSNIVQCMLLLDMASRRNCERTSNVEGISIDDQTFDWGDETFERSPTLNLNERQTATLHPNVAPPEISLIPAKPLPFPDESISTWKLVPSVAPIPLRRPVYSVRPPVPVRQPKRVGLEVPELPLEPAKVVPVRQMVLQRQLTPVRSELQGQGDGSPLPYMPVTKPRFIPNGKEKIISYVNAINPF